MRSIAASCGSCPGGLKLCKRLCILAGSQPSCMTWPRDLTSLCLSVICRMGLSEHLLKRSVMPWVTTPVAQGLRTGRGKVQPAWDASEGVP